MNKKNEKQIVGIAKKEIEKFTKEWKRNPYVWESEADVHAELYNKIKLKLCSVEYRYRKEMVQKETFSQVYCKPKIYIRGEKYCYYPDIVIYKNVREIRNVGERENDPMLWVCEIKYITEWSSMLAIDNVKSDINKLECLLKQKRGGADYACYLILQRRARGKSECGYDRELYPYLQLSKKNEIQKILENLKERNERLWLFRRSIGYKK